MIKLFIATKACEQCLKTSLGKKFGFISIMYKSIMYK